MLFLYLLFTCFLTSCHEADATHHTTKTQGDWQETTQNEKVEEPRKEEPGDDNTLPTQGNLEHLTDENLADEQQKKTQAEEARKLEDRRQTITAVLVEAALWKAFADEHWWAFQLNFGFRHLRYEVLNRMYGIQDHFSHRYGLRSVADAIKEATGGHTLWTLGSTELNNRVTPIIQASLQTCGVNGVDLINEPSDDVVGDILYPIVLRATYDYRLAIDALRSSKEVRMLLERELPIVRSAMKTEVMDDILIRISAIPENFDPLVNESLNVLKDFDALLDHYRWLHPSWDKAEKETTL